MIILLANTEDAYGFPPFSIMERAITLRPRNLRKGKKQTIAELRSLERGILENFLHNISVTRLTSPNFGWADVIPQRVLQPSGRRALVEDRTRINGWTAHSGGGMNGESSVLAYIDGAVAKNGDGKHRSASRKKQDGDDGERRDALDPAV